MNREEKSARVAQWRAEMNEADLIIILDHGGLDGVKANELRERLRAHRARYRVLKNTLARLAIKDQPFEALGAYFEGQTAMITATGDPVALTKILVDYLKRDLKTPSPRYISTRAPLSIRTDTPPRPRPGPTLELRGGWVEGELLDDEAMKGLAKLPTKEQAQQLLLGLLQAPQRRLLRVLEAPGAGLLRALDARKQGLE